MRPETGAVGQPQPLGPWLEPADLFSDDPSFTGEDFTLDFCPQPLPRSSSSAQTSRGTASCGRGCQGKKIKAGAIQQPPGSLASTVKVSSLWNSLHRWICESRAGALKVFFHTTFLKQGSEANIPHTSEAVWPLPIPFWNFAVGVGLEDDSHLKRAINVLIVVLNWLQLGCPRRPPRTYSARQPLNHVQSEVVSRFEKIFAAWSISSPVTAADMGRSAGKVETMEKQIAQITLAALNLRRNSYGTAKHRRDQSAEQAKAPSLTIAKDVEASRLSLSGRPSFDPTNFLPASTEAWYSRPLDLALPLEDYLDELPHVQVKGSRAEVLKLLHSLDNSFRLAIFPEQDSRTGVRSGMFALMKSLDKDRLILDCRPANCLEEPISDYTQCMAAATPILDIVLADNHVILASGEDLKDFYYFFSVSDQRASRNCLSFELSEKEARLFSCFDGATSTTGRYVPALRTMAMGDLNAVEYGQAAHTLLALRQGLRFQDMLCMRGRAPRGALAVGLVIDDLICLEQVPAGVREGKLSEGFADAMVQAYQDVGLVANESKRFRNELVSKFWGISLDGRTGLVRAQLDRAVPTAMLTAQVARMGHGERKLLEVLAGMWVSLLQLRRPAMCLLSQIFIAIQSADYGEVFKLTAAVVAELWTLVAVAPLLCSDLRAAVSSDFCLVDASDDWEAEVSSVVDDMLAKELARQKLSRAAWSRLLSPLQVLRRLRGVGCPEDEVPEGETAARCHPLWLGVVRSKHFTLVKRKRIRSRVHINLSELNAAMTSLERRCLLTPDSRLLLGSDSQVVLGALVRGRSSSRVLNNRLKTGLPWLLAFNNYVCAQYVPTGSNVADDPTRDRPCREPPDPMPSWISGISAGDFQQLDDVLEAAGVSDALVARLPDFPDIAVAELDTTSFHKSSRYEHWRTRVSKMRKRDCSSPPAAISAASPWLHVPSLSSEAVAALLDFDDSQFVYPKGVNRDKCRKRTGHLDLFSGSRAAAKALAEETKCWVLTFDLKHSLHEDLLDRQLQSKIHQLLRLKCFLSLSGGPVCASFSRAVRPAVRDKDHPEGLQAITSAMRVKVDIGNAMSCWVASTVKQADQCGLVWWVENPAGSFLWQMPEWRRLLVELDCDFFTTDYCRWGTPYRKRTRFLTSGVSAGERLLCNCESEHVRLSGYSRYHRCSWTQVAEPYPASLSRFLAKLVHQSLLPVERRCTLDAAACARSSSRRIGEAKNPGPRARRDQGPFATDLELIDTVRPATRLLQSKAVDKFDRWIRRNLPEGTCKSLLLLPRMRLLFLRTFGNELFKRGEAMYIFRHLVVHLQQTYPGERTLMAPAWDLLSRWEIAEPVNHRPPIPRKVLDSFLSLALMWGWYRFACVTALAFHGAMRVGEPLRAVRSDLVLPAEACLQEEVCFLRIRAPKSGRRGKGRVQHTKICDALVVRLVAAVFQDLEPEAPLYPSSASSYLRRWNKIAEALSLPVEAQITPGSLRPGGTIFLYHSGLPIADLMWRLRLRNISTLESYLQETGAINIFASLPLQVKHNVQHCSEMFPHLCKAIITRSSLT